MKRIKEIKNFKAIIVLSIIGLLIVFSTNVLVGNTTFRISDLYKIIFKSENEIGANILLYSRLPRALSSIFAGCALSVSGCVLQNVLSNPLASPSVIGVNAGAGLGVTIACALGFISGFETSLFSFFGAFFAVLLITAFSKQSFFSKSSVILGGVALNSVFNALNEAICSLDTDIALSNAEFRIGGFTTLSYSKLLPPFAIIIFSVLVLFFLLCELDVLSQGDENALSVGLNAKKYRMIFLLLSALLAGAAVSFSGLLGFIGLIIPHFTRKVVGNESKKLIPFSAVTGAIFVCFCDFISRMIFYPYEIPVGVIMSLIGGPLFVFILIKTRKRGYYA